MLQAESQHRGHAIIEGVHADLRAGALAHLPSGQFAANAAWLQCAVMAFNLTRTAGAMASPQRHLIGSNNHTISPTSNMPPAPAKQSAPGRWRYETRSPTVCFNLG